MWAPEFEDDPHLYVLKPTNDFVSLGCPNSPLYAKPIAEGLEIEETDMSSQIHSNASDVKVGYFRTLKEAEHAAAKVALMSLSLDGFQE
ncbi:unnamed protein product [Camellia sinensis]